MDLTPAPSPALALLVDGENLSKDRAAEVMKAARRFGDPQVRRVYGNLNAISGWEDHGFRLCPTRPGKNAADMLLCVEAAVLALRDGFETLVIASSDRDFSYLAEQMREAGKRVVGMGQPSAPASFRATCSQFEVLSPPAIAPSAPEPKSSGPSTMLDKVRFVVRASGPAGFPLASLGPAMQQQGIKIAETPEKSWRAWLTARPNVFVCDPKGPEARVRLKA
ncbi:NYN domain-containing protein [Rhodobacter sp. Har01]|uniref:NYN domain-containing protein n=1 Tax=Rhodobacter sp. Har01 TaxID=2883999 RepID=UPI001D07AA12|nr:NYN domain-containing protein [Rhodobacter sp. Har01]MCB6179377.1 NYN domain-containing protein [Rhodobacter sp. Har01]